MEKEKVLEIEIIKINNNYSYCKIKHQNKKVLKIGEFKDTIQGSILFYIESLAGPSFDVGIDNSSGFKFASLRIRGTDETDNEKPFLIQSKNLQYLEEIVNKINEKYGIPKRWRAEKYKEYCFLNSYGYIISCLDFYEESDNKNYELGNYFKTREEAQKVIDSKEYQNFWAKVRAGEIGGDE